MFTTALFNIDYYERYSIFGIRRLICKSNQNEIILKLLRYLMFIEIKLSLLFL